LAPPADHGGDLIVAFVVWDNGEAAAVTDSEGNAYASAVGPTQAAGDPSSAQIFFAANVAGGSDTITASFATPITAPDGDIVEDAVAAAAGSHGATATLSSGAWLLQLAAFTPAG
jgi:hypothetical protein